MQNVDMSVEGSTLIIRVNLDVDLGPSKSLKTNMVATTKGNVRVEGRDEYVGLNIYRK